ncbi:CRE-SRG-32 protein [Aphelenchoides avenae]|nr:CRE-SRG-32 protein [Aphelenchus avenae]
MDRWENLRVIIPLIYGIPSIIASIVVVTTICLRCKEYFYVIFAIASATDWLAWIFTYICMRGYGSPIYFDWYDKIPTSGIWPTFLHFCMFYFMYIQYGTCLLVGINRLSAVVAHQKYKRFWKKYFKLIIALLFAYPLPLTYHIIQYGATITLFPAGPGYAPFYLIGVHAPKGNELVAKRSSLFQLICCLVDGVALLFINVGIAIFLYRRRRMLIRTENLTEDTRDTEFKLYALTCVLSVFLFLAFATQVAYFFFGDRMSLLDQGIVIMVATWAIDLHTCSSPWFLLFMSRAVREEMGDLFPFLRSFKPSTVTSVIGLRSDTASS